MGITSRPYDAERDQLILSFVRTYITDVADNSAVREKPLDFKESTALLQKCGITGKILAALLLNDPSVLDSPARIAASVETAVLRSTIMPTRMKKLPTPELKAEIQSKYPKAYEEFEKWASTPPRKYFQAELTPEFLVSLAAPLREAIKSALAKSGPETGRT